MAYQGTFAIITAALISGAIVERMRFGPYLAFITLWALFVYAPVAHWVWGGGWLAQARRARLRGRHGRARQRRGGRARRARWSSGRARTTRGRRSCRTTSRSRCSARGCSGSAGSASTPAARSPRTRSRPSRSSTRCSRRSATLVVWTLLDLARTGGDGGRRRDGDRRRPGRDHAGGRLRVARCPRSSSARSRRSRATSRCCGARARALDDSLDVVAAHGVGGTVGRAADRRVRQKAWNGVADGLLFGNPRQLGIQAVGVARDDRLQRRRARS